MSFMMLSSMLGFFTLIFLIVSVIYSVKISKIAVGTQAWKVIAIGCILTAVQGLLGPIALGFNISYRYSVLPASIIWLVGCVCLVYGCYTLNDALRKIG